VIIPNETKAKNSSKILINNSSDIELSFETPCSGEGNESGWQWYQYTKVVFPYLYIPLYFRMAAKANTETLEEPSWSIQSCSNDFETCCDTVQTIVGNRWYVNTTDDQYKSYYEFQLGEIDITGFPTYKIYGNITLNLNNSYYNGTSLILYCGDNSYADREWWSHQGNIWYEYSTGAYYGILQSGSPNKYVKYIDNSWLISSSNLKSYWRGQFHVWEGGAFEIGWSVASNDSRYLTEYLDLAPGKLEVTMKFVPSLREPITAPSILHIFPWDDNGDRNPYTLVTIYDNEEIYRRASEDYGYQYVLIHEQYFNYTLGYQEIPNYWKPYNTSIAIAINHIINYTHKYNMGFGLYFGTIHGTKWGSLTTYNESSILAINESWNAFHTYWENKSDFYYFDGAMTDFTGGPQQNFSYYIIKILEPIFADIINNEHKMILHNSYAGQCWWFGNYLVPLRFEGVTLTNIRNLYMGLYAGDPWAHNLNYPWVMFISPIFDVAQNWSDYNNMKAIQLIKICYEWGVTLEGTYNFMNKNDFSYHNNITKFWKGGMTRTQNITSISGPLGSTCVLETNSQIAIFIENTEMSASISITPEKLLIENIYNNQYHISLSVINGTNINTIIHVKPYWSILTETDTGKVVPTETSKISLIFNAESNTRYTLTISAAPGSAPGVLNYLILILSCFVISFACSMLNKEKEFSIMVFLSCFSITVAVLVWISLVPSYLILLSVLIIVGMLFMDTKESVIK
jgi:hypothetical protein